MLLYYAFVRHVTPVEVPSSCRFFMVSIVASSCNVVNLHLCALSLLLLLGSVGCVYRKVSKIESRSTLNNLPVISTSPSVSIALSIALCLAWFAAFSNFLAFFPETGAKGPLVGYSTLLFLVPRAFLVTPFCALRFWTFVRLAIRRCLLGTLGLPLDGILVMLCCKAEERIGEII
jgi:hypothetical protein